MKKIILLFLCFFSSLALGAEGLGIGSGPTTGTNYAMIQDLKKVCANELDITNYETEGSYENIAKIIYDKRVQYGIVKVDDLFYQRALNSKVSQDILMILPFFSVEVHLIAASKSPITSLNDLAGRRVVEGPVGSGTWVTAQVIKSITKLDWVGLNLSQEDGLKAVQTGTADAEFIVAGKPIPILKTATGVKLVSVINDALEASTFYTKTVITENVYPWQLNRVMTYRVDNILATYNYSSERQKAIANEIVSCIIGNLTILQTTVGFHQKWRDVDPAAINKINWPMNQSLKQTIARILAETNEKKATK